MLSHSHTSSCKISEKIKKDRYPAENAEREDGKGDVKINIKESFITAHRSVLMSSSDYFKTMFSGGFSETNADEIDLSELFDEMDELNIVLDYMYTGIIVLSEQNIASVLNTACHFLLTELQDACCSFLRVNISPQTSFPILTLAERYSLKGVQDICVEVIRAWFPFSLCHNPEAVQTPPHCLNVLIKENVLKVLPKDKRKEFLQLWYDNFRSANDVSQSLPLEVCDTLQQESIIPHSQPQSSFVEEKHSAMNKAEEILFSVFTGSATNDTSSCIEVHAFAPQLNRWKMVLKHTLTKEVKEEVASLLGITEEVKEGVPLFVGITETTAYFLFLKVGLPDSEECIIAVELKSNVTSVIKLPECVYKSDGQCYGGQLHYFMWNDELFGLFWEIKGPHYSQRGWSIFRYSESRNWEKVCDFLCEFPLRDTEFLMKAVGDTMYIWWKEYNISGSAIASVHYSFSSLIRSSEDGEFKVKELKPPRTCDHESGEYFEYDFSALSSIVLDEHSQNLSFIHILDSGDYTATEEVDWHDEHEYQVLTYDTTRDDWTEGDVCRVSHPDVGYTIAEPGKKTYITKQPIMPPVKRIIFHKEIDTKKDPDSDDDDSDDDDDDDCHMVEKGGPEMCIGALYYLKTTSPYNTTLWKLKTADKEWDVIAHLPHSLDRFPTFQTGELRTDFLISMPDSEFKDFSCEIGESAIAFSESEEAAKGLEMEFSEELLNPEMYDRKWGELWF